MNKAKLSGAIMNIRSKAGFTLFELVLAATIILVVGTIAVSEAHQYRERQYVASMKNDLQNFVYAQENRFRDDRAYSDLVDLNDHHFSRHVEVDAVNIGSERVYLRVRHTRSDYQCSVDYSSVSRNAHNRVNCFLPTITPEIIGGVDPPIAIADTFIASLPDTIVWTHPEVTPPLVQTVSPGGVRSDAFYVRNLSSIPRTYSFIVNRLDPSVVQLPTTPTALMLTPGEIQSVSVQYEMASSVVAGSRSPISLTAIDTEDTSRRGSAQFEVIADTMLLSPEGFGPPSQVSYPGSNVNVDFYVRNRSNEGRQFGFNPTVDDGAIATIVSAPSDMVIAPYSMVRVPVTYRVYPGTPLGSVVNVSMESSDVLRPDLSVINTFPVTSTNPTMPPVLIAPSTQTVEPGVSGVVEFGLFNQSGTDRTYQFTTSSSTPSVASAAGTPANVTVASGDTVLISVPFSVSSPQGAGNSTSISLLARDVDATTLTASGAFTVQVAEVLANPSVSSPWSDPIQTGSPGDVFSNQVSVTNHSNASRDFCFASLVSYSGSNPISTIALPPCQTIGGYATVQVTLGYEVSPVAPPLSWWRYQLVVMDQAAPSYVGGGSGSSMIEFSTAGMPAAPSVSLANFGVSPGASGSGSFTVENLGSVSQTFVLSRTLSGSALLSVNLAESSVTVNAGETSTVGFTWVARDSITVGTSSNLNIVAADGGYSDFGSATVSTNMVLANPSQGPWSDTLIDVYPGDVRTISRMIYNHSNAPREIGITRIYLFVDAPGFITAASPLASPFLIPAYDSLLVDFDIQVGLGTPGHRNDLSSYVWDELDPSYSNLGSGPARFVLQGVGDDPVLTVPDFNIDPNESGSGVLDVHNPGTLSATYSLSRVITGSTLQSLVLSASSVTVGAGATVQVPFTFVARDSILVGTVSEVVFEASEGSFSGTATSVFNTNLVLAAPTMFSWSDVTVMVEPGQSYSVSRSYRNNTNAPRMMRVALIVHNDVGTPMSGVPTIVPQLISVDAYSTQVVNFGVVIRSDASNGDRLRFESTVVDDLEPSYWAGGIGEGSVTFIVDFVETFAPVVTVPDFAVNPAESGSGLVGIHNPSTISQTYSVTQSVSGSTLQSFNLSSGSVTVGAGATVQVPFTFVARDSILAGSVTNVTVVANDGSLSGSAVSRFETNLLLATPTMFSWSESIVSVEPGQSYLVTRAYRNNTNASRAMRVTTIVHNEVGTPVGTVAISPQLTVVSAYGTQIVSFEVPVVSGASNGDRVRLESIVADDLAPAYWAGGFGGGDVTFDVNFDVLMAPEVTAGGALPAWLLVGDNSSVSFSVRSHSDGVRTYQATATGVRSSPGVIMPSSFSLAKDGIQNVSVPFTVGTQSFFCGSAGAILEVRDSGEPSLVGSDQRLRGVSSPLGLLTDDFGSGGFGPYLGFTTQSGDVSHSFAGGRLRMSATSGVGAAAYLYLRSMCPGDLQNSRVSAEVSNFNSTDASGVVQFDIGAADGAAIRISGNGSITFGMNVASVYYPVHSAVYDPVAHRVLAVRESGGRIYFEHSFDGSSWISAGDAVIPGGWDFRRTWFNFRVSRSGGVVATTSADLGRINQ
jgi:Tfp pilus assembly protein PilE